MNFIFTITTGRSGTAYLSELLKNIPNSQSHHERLGPSAWGIMTPDVSQFMAYNMLGNNEYVRDFWKRKAKLIKEICTDNWYIETSHVLSKAGLIENIDVFDGEVYIICLHRDPEKVIKSMISRNDYTSLGTMWLWLLDPNYEKNITRPADASQETLCKWYVNEMKARETLLKTENNANYIDADLETIATSRGAKELLNQFAKTDTFSLPCPQN